MPTAQDFYKLFSSHRFKKVNETIQDGFFGMYFVLRILAENVGGLSAGDIAKMFGVTSARTAVILTSLAKKGYITKQKAKDDARKTIVKITDTGEEVLAKRKKKLFNILDEFLVKLSEEEIKSFYSVLEKLLFC